MQYLVASSEEIKNWHITSKESWQRCFFVRQRTMLRNRIHRLLGGQHGSSLPQCSDLFGSNGAAEFAFRWFGQYWEIAVRLFKCQQSVWVFT